MKCFGELSAEASVFVDRLLPRCEFPPVGTAVLCGVSGGADSLALLVLSCAAGLDVTAAHVDHGLRPGSDVESETVRQAAERFGAKFRAFQVVVAEGSDLEQRARVARHGVLGPDALLGHTADDQAETVLINIVRGSGLFGLAGMDPGGRHPLLRLRRSETHRLCSSAGLDPVEDPSNRDPRFVRNRIRADVLPLLRDISKRDVVPLLVRTADLARSTAADLAILAASVDVVDTMVLRSYPKTVAVTALRDWLRDELGHPPSAAELDRVWSVVTHEVIACELTGGRRVARTNGILRIER